MTLSLDKCRCAGRRDLTAETAICAKRTSCARYVTFAEPTPGGGMDQFCAVMWLCDLPQLERFIKHVDGEA